MQYSTYVGRGRVVVLDNRGNIFYDYTPESYKPFFFNVNIKNPRIHGDAYKVTSRLDYLVKLPKGKYFFPQELKITFTNDDTKASVNLKDGKLTINEKYRKYPIWMIYFLYFHEVAHFLYPSGKLGRTAENEFRCDRLAAKLMLTMGFNPSQILAAMKFGLDNGSEQNYRYKRMVNYLNEVKTVIKNE